MSASKAGPVLIAGGGIGGLAAAVALQRRGWDVEVFERSQTAVPERGTALTLWGNATTVMDRLGCGEALRAAGSVVQRSEIRSASGRVLIETPVSEVSRHTGTIALVVRRSDLQRVLFEALDSVPVHLGRRCTGYRADSRGVMLRLDDGTEIRGSVLIGAEGARSAVREQLIGDGAPTPVGSPIWRGISAADSGLEPGLALLIWGSHGGGIGGAFIPPGSVSWTIAANSAHQPLLSDGNHKAGLLSFISGLNAELEEAVRLTPADAMISGHVLVREPTETWGDGAVTLLGDAAHAMPTALGQGACQALEDAYVLGESLLDSSDIDGGLRRYEQVRRQRVDWMRKRVDRIDRFSRMENPILCKLRNLGARLAPTGSVKSWEQIMTIDV